MPSHRPPPLARFDFFAIVALNGGMRVSGVVLFVGLLSLTFQYTLQPILIATHEARFDAEGRLLPWIAWNTALEAAGERNTTCGGAVLALYAKAMHSRALAGQARQALKRTLYSIDNQGRPRDLCKNPQPGCWQEGAHTDVVDNYADALRAFPERGAVDCPTLCN